MFEGVIKKKKKKEGREKVLEREARWSLLIYAKRRIPEKKNSRITFVFLFLCFLTDRKIEWYRSEHDLQKRDFSF